MNQQEQNDDLLGVGDVDETDKSPSSTFYSMNVSTYKKLLGRYIYVGR